jgi:pyridoxal phosphate enzyme (YggS family)
MVQWKSSVFPHMVFDNLKSVLKRIETAAERAGRRGDDVKVVAVVKKAAVSDLKALLESGAVPYIGENRIQDAEKRRQELGSLAERAVWRFIGHLQANKARRALDLFDRIDTLDSLRLAQALDRHLAELGKTARVLIQVKLTEKETQSGIPLETVGEFLGQLRALPRLEPSGLMAIAPMLDPEKVRPYFRAAREVFEKHFSDNEKQPELSMGMSQDFEVAVEEGANLVRIGTSLFGSGMSRDTADNSTTMEGSNDRESACHP